MIERAVVKRLTGLYMAVKLIAMFRPVVTAVWSPALLLSTPWHHVLQQAFRFGSCLCAACSSLLQNCATIMMKLISMNCFCCI